MNRIAHSDRDISRRLFVGGALAVGAGHAIIQLTGCNPGAVGSPEEQQADGATEDTNTGTTDTQSSSASDETTVGAFPPDESSVFVVRNTDGTDDGVQRLIDLMKDNNTPFYQTAASPQGLFASNDVVILKINCQWAERGGTNTDFLEKVVMAMKAHPDGFVGEVIVADNGQAQYGTDGKGGSLSWSETNSADKKRSALDVVNAFKKQMTISGLLWDDFTMNKVMEFSQGDRDDGFVIEDSARSTGIIISYPKFTTENGTHVSFKEGIWDPITASYNPNRLKIINLPVLKVHSGYQVTGAVKNYMGTTASRLTGQTAHNSIGMGGMGTQLAYTRMPTLNIIDMIWVGTRRGPNTLYENADKNNMIACSRDPVALDWWCTHNVLIPLVAASGGDTARLDPDSSNQGMFGAWLGLTVDELVAAGFAANRGEAVKVFD